MARPDWLDTLLPREEALHVTNPDATLNAAEFAVTRLNRRLALSLGPVTLELGSLLSTTSRLSASPSSIPRVRPAAPPGLPTQGPARMSATQEYIRADGDFDPCG
jgi:hypothetical protein